MRVTVLVLTLGLLVIPGAAAAQTGVKPIKERKWTFEIMAGGALGTSPGGDGTAPTFAAGDVFTTDAGTPTRAVPSWFFGDGAVLFNQVKAQFASAFGQQFPEITPLDNGLAAAGLRRGSGATFGARLTRRVTNRLGVEVAFQRSGGRMELTDDVRNAIETSRASFESAFRGLFATMPQTGLQVSSSATLPSGVSGAQTSLTGALRFTITRGGRLETYAVAGAGRVTNSSDTAEARLRGSYQFRFFDTYSFAQDDSVTIRYAQKESAIVGVAGAGLMYDLGARQGIRLDVRVHAGDGASTTTLAASPTNATNNPPLALPSNTSPSIQFSNSAAARASLSGQLTDRAISSGGGLETRVLGTVGFYIRF